MSTQFSKRALAGLGASALALLAQTQRASADTFAPTGTPTPRTMPGVKNVKDYGAAGNGATDDTAAIQAALNAAYGPPSSPNGLSSNLNCAVFFPPGTYIITAPLTIKWTQGAYVFGSGMGTTIISNKNSSNPSVFVINGVGFSTFEEMRLIAAPGGIAFDYDWDGTGPVAAQMNTFNHIFFQGGAYGCRVGFSQYQCDTSTWINCFFASATTAGLAILNFNSLLHNVYGGNFQNNYCGIFVGAGSVPIISGVGFEQSADYDIRMQGGALDCYLISGIRTESKNFFIGTNIAMSFALVACNQANANAGVFASAYGSLSLKNCWTEAGTINSGGQTACELSVDNCRSGLPVSQQPEIALSNFRGKVIHWPLRARLFNDLPASPYAGMEANITDATVNTFGATVSAGGGSNRVKIRYNGTNWTVMGI